MSFSAYTVAFAPMIPWPAIAAFAIAGALILALGAWRRGRGLVWRGVGVAILIAILANPALVREQRTPERDIAVVVLDESPSQDIGDRSTASAAALKQVTDELAKDRDVEVRVVRAGEADTRRRRRRHAALPPRSAASSPTCRASASPG